MSCSGFWREKGCQKGSFSSCFFLRARKTPKNKDFFSTCRSPRIPAKEGEKTLEKNKEFPNPRKRREKRSKKQGTSHRGKEKQGISKKQGRKDREKGSVLKSGPHLNPVTINPVIRISVLGHFQSEGFRGSVRAIPSPGACNPCFEAQTGRPRKHSLSGPVRDTPPISRNTLSTPTPPADQFLSAIF